MPTAIRIGLLASALVLAGCYRYAPVEVTVVNSVTQQPVPGATVMAGYNSYANVIHPDLSQRLTDADGHVRVRVAQGRIDAPFAGIWARKEGFELGHFPNVDTDNLDVAAVAAQMVAEKGRATITLTPR